MSSRPNIMDFHGATVLNGTIWEISGRGREAKGCIARDARAYLCDQKCKNPFNKSGLNGLERLCSIAIE